MSEIRDTSSLPFSLSIISTLKSHGFNVLKDFEDISLLDLQQECQFTQEDALEIWKTINSMKVSNENTANVSTIISNSTKDINGISIKDILMKISSQKPIITMCRALDAILGGGVQIGQIVSLEII